ncbi:MAG: DNA polymerase IV [Lachnospiraceae bacterium]|nr:DNA polymerase IV [Lachnospiraceae bacterium]
MTAQSVIFHVDVNSAFLSWEAIYRRNAGMTDMDLRTIPSAVGGDSEKRHGIILAKSIPAKRFGVQTGEPVIKALEKCPELVLVSPHYPYYEECSGKLMRLLSEYSSLVVPLSIDEAFLDMSESVALFGDPMEIARKIRERVRDEFGFTVNIGISSNKFLAKMASDFKKPDLCHSLFPEEIPAKLWPLPIRDLYGAGRATQTRLSTLGLKTIGDVAATDREILKAHLGKSHGEMIWKHANGIDPEPLVLEDGPLKGYGNSITLSMDITDTDIARQVLLSLSETVGARLRAANVTCEQVTVELKDAEFVRRTHQCPLLSATNSTDIIYRTACKLLSEFWHNEPIRLLGIRTGRISEESFSQMNLFDFDVQKSAKLEKLDRAIDSIRSRFGNDAVKRASFLSPDTPRDPGGRDRRSKLFGHTED